MGARTFIIRGVEVAIVLLWVGLLGATVHNGGRGIPGANAGSEGGMALLEAVDSEDAEWMGVYMEGQKIGAALSDRLPTADGFRIQERSYLKIRAFEQDKEITTAFVAEVTKKGTLSSFSFYLSAPPVRTDVTGEVRGENLFIAISSGGEITNQKVYLPDGPPEIALTFKERAVADDPAIGSILEMPYFDPATLGQRTMTIKVVDTGLATFGGEETKTYTLEADYQGMTSKSVVTQGGITLSEEGALGMTLKRESREDALYEGWGDKPPADIIALSVVPVAKPIDSPRDVRRMVILLKGGGVEALLAEAYGAINLDYQGALTIERADISTLTPPMLPVVDPQFEPYLEATATLQSDDPNIQQVSRQIVDDDLRSDLAARKLMDFVFNHLEKVPTVGIPNAREALAVGQGDCNEHTALFTALARASGLPTRIAAGIVYSDTSFGGQGFFYHAWPEVYLGEWVAIDPTFGQFPADATHVKLVEGDLNQQVALIRVVGNLSIEIVETK